MFADDKKQQRTVTHDHSDYQIIANNQLNFSLFAKKKQLHLTRESECPIKENALGIEVINVKKYTYSTTTKTNQQTRKCKTGMEGTWNSAKKQIN